MDKALICMKTCEKSESISQIDALNFPLFFFFSCLKSLKATVFKCDCAMKNSHHHFQSGKTGNCFSIVSNRCCNTTKYTMRSNSWEIKIPTWKCATNRNYVGGRRMEAIIINFYCFQASIIGVYHLFLNVCHKSCA